MAESYFKYWGKADRDNPVSKYHLLPYHGLDVAAVGKVLLDRNTWLTEQLSRLCGINKKKLIPILIFILALHDLGKFSESFQYLIPELLQKLQRKKSSLKQPYSKKVFCHGSMGFLLWDKLIFNLFIEWMGVEKVDDKEDWRDLLKWFMEASNGHHGLPVKQGKQSIDFFYCESNKHDALKFVVDIIDLFSFKENFPTALIHDYDRLYDSLAKASWPITGFIVLCDWIGSGKIFKHQSHEQSLHHYWNNTALKTAEKAIEKAGILPCQINRQLDPLTELLNLPANSQLTPLQKLCSNIPILDKPQLFIIEDQTGSGKTEASLILLNRLMANGQAGGGFYLALPTMATADGIFPRVQKTYNSLYLPDEKPSLVLSHSSAKLSDRFSATIISAEKPVSEQIYGDDAQSRCQAWLSDNRKKALLSHVGVGTIDQTFLAALKTKYQSLRLIGLIGKILVIDEAHAYDAYMGKELEVLLKIHAALGGSAIIMSATLPFSTRQNFVDAFSKGIGSTDLELHQRKAYPLLTHVAEGYKKELSFSFKKEKTSKNVRLKFLNAEADVERIIEKSIRKNQCICWIRNSVKDARETYQRLKNNSLKVDLFHARFTIADRLNIQTRVLKAFDKDSVDDQRAGRIVIATQVVEQSLDLDFDVMVTDLAPIDLMLQRAGRMHRHTRDKLGNPKTTGKDERGEATLYILSPDYTDEPKEDWLSSFFPNAKKVYENHARLWLGLKQLIQLPEKKLPKNIRNLIEHAYDKEAKIPQGLLRSDINADGNEQCQRTMGIFNTIDFEAGYTMNDQQWPEDMKMPTRLGDETLTLTLAKWENGKLAPFNSDEKRPWQYSEIRVLEKSIARVPEYEQKLESAIEVIKMGLPAQGKWANLLPMVWKDEERLWEGNIIDGRGEIGKVYYHFDWGLIYGYEFKPKQTEGQLETEELI